MRKDFKISRKFYIKNVTKYNKILKEICIKQQYILKTMYLNCDLNLIVIIV